MTQNKATQRKPEIVIRPPDLLANINLRELWAYRGLIASLVKRRLRTEFSQQHFAFVWLIARPVLLVACFSLFKGLAAANPGTALPYPLYLYAGVVFWFFFTDAVTDTAASIRHDSGLIQKVYFPRLVSPLTSLLTNLYRLAIASLPIFALMVYYGTYPGPLLALLPLVLLQLFMLIFGLGCLFASISITNRDWDRLLAFALYVGLFVSPVLYASTMIPERFQLIYSINPMVGTLDAVRSTLFDGTPWPAATWSYSMGVSLVACVVGLAAFQTAEKYFVDKL